MNMNWTNVCHEEYPFTAENISKPSHVKVELLKIYFDFYRVSQ